MSTKLWPALALFGYLAAGCGGSAKPAESAADTGREDAPTDAADETANDAKPESGAASGSSGVPSDCHKPSGTCLPDPKFVKKLCNNRHPSMAIYLFANGSKWGRAYLTRKTEAWNASGGASAGGFLEFDEEVLLLFERKADTGGMQVSGAGAGYDALRWDGSCVTLSGEEVTTQKPPTPKTPKIEWRYLDDNVQQALRKDSAVDAAYLERRRECKGAVSGDVSLKCVKADAKLSEAIVSYARGGGEVPLPSTLPE